MFIQETVAVLRSCRKMLSLRFQSLYDLSCLSAVDVVTDSSLVVVGGLVKVAWKRDSISCFLFL